MSTGSAMLSNLLILCRLLLLLSSILPASGSFPMSWLFTLRWSADTLIWFPRVFHNGVSAYLFNLVSYKFPASPVPPHPLLPPSVSLPFTSLHRKRHSLGANRTFSCSSKSTTTLHGFCIFSSWDSICLECHYLSLANFFLKTTSGTFGEGISSQCFCHFFCSPLRDHSSHWTINLIPTGSEALWRLELQLFWCYVPAGPGTEQAECALGEWMSWTQQPAFQCSLGSHPWIHQHIKWGRCRSNSLCAVQSSDFWEWCSHGSQSELHWKLIEA